MITHVFPRFYSQLRESGLVRGQFTFTDADDSWAAVSSNGYTYPGFTVADGGTGLVTVTFPKCRDIEVVHASLRNATPGTFGNVRQIELPPMSQAIAKAGTFGIALYKEDGTSGVPALADPADQAVLALVLWLAR
jgi:hypothetical protein